MICFYCGFLYGIHRNHRLIKTNLVCELKHQQVSPRNALNRIVALYYSDNVSNDRTTWGHNLRIKNRFLTRVFLLRAETLLMTVYKIPPSYKNWKVNFLIQNSPKQSYFWNCGFHNGVQMVWIILQNVKLNQSINQIKS